MDWTEDKRNTPQAFSHWTYIQSEKQLMIVDIQVIFTCPLAPRAFAAAPVPMPVPVPVARVSCISAAVCSSILHTDRVSRAQGVGDVWTDPQFHTSYSTSDFGKGNLEQMGIDGFFKSHKCNNVCEFLGIGKVRSRVICTNQYGLPIAFYMPQDAKGGVGTVAPRAAGAPAPGGFKSQPQAAVSEDADRSSLNGGQENVNVVIKHDDQKQCCVCQ